MSSTDEETPPRVVIVGAGFAGIACARELGDKGVAVTLIDQHTYHEFQPLLYQVATAQLAPGDIMAPLRGLFRKQESVDVKQAQVAKVDVANRSVITTEGHTHSGDHLVLAIGAEPNFFGVPGAEEHSFPLYSTDDARHLRNRVLQMFEDADNDPSRIDRGALNMVIVGAGATGVETAGALADLVHDAMPERYHDLAVSRAKVYLVDHAHAPLTPFSEKAQKYAADQLVRKGVQLQMGMTVTEVREDSVLFADGTEIATHCVVWAGGLKARTLPGLEELPTSRGGRITIQPDLSVEGHPGVYALGDCAATPGPDGAVLPQLGSVAQQAGSSAAASILASIGGTTPRPFHYHDKGIMAMIGRRAAIAEVGANHHELHGVIAFSAWLGVHAWLMSTTRERIDAFMSWAWDSFSKSRTPAVIVDPDATHIDWGDSDHSDDDTEQTTRETT